MSNLSLWITLKKLVIMNVSTDEWPIGEIAMKVDSLMIDSVVPGIQWKMATKPTSISIHAVSFCLDTSICYFLFNTWIVTKMVCECLAVLSDDLSWETITIHIRINDMSLSHLLAATLSFSLHFLEALHFFSQLSCFGSDFIPFERGLDFRVKKSTSAS